MIPKDHCVFNSQTVQKLESRTDVFMFYSKQQDFDVIFKILILMNSFSLDLGWFSWTQL